MAHSRGKSPAPVSMAVRLAAMNIGQNPTNEPHDEDQHILQAKAGMSSEDIKLAPPQEILDKYSENTAVLDLETKTVAELITSVEAIFGALQAAVGFATAYGVTHQIDTVFSFFGLDGFEALTLALGVVFTYFIGLLRRDLLYATNRWDETRSGVKSMCTCENSGVPKFHPEAGSFTHTKKVTKGEADQFDATIGVALKSAVEKKEARAFEKDNCTWKKIKGFEVITLEALTKTIGTDSCSREYRGSTIIAFPIMSNPRKIRQSDFTAVRVAFSQSSLAGSMLTVPHAHKIMRVIKRREIGDGHAVILVAIQPAALGRVGKPYRFLPNTPTINCIVGWVPEAALVVGVAVTFSFKFAYKNFQVTMRPTVVNKPNDENNTDGGVINDQHRLQFRHTQRLNDPYSKEGLDGSSEDGWLLTNPSTISDLTKKWPRNR